MGRHEGAAFIPDRAGGTSKPVPISRISHRFPRNLPEDARGEIRKIVLDWAKRQLTDEGLQRPVAQSQLFAGENAPFESQSKIIREKEVS